MNQLLTGDYAAMKLYHCTIARSLRPLWTLEEMGLDYELIVLPFPPRVFEKSYLSINPLGTVPYFEDGDVKMTESSGICHYLVERYGPSDLAVDKDDPYYGDYLNWLYQSDATITFPQTVYLRYTQLEPEERRLPQAAEDYRKFFLGRLRWLDAALETREYLCAGRFTIADICVSYALVLARNIGLAGDFPERVADYMARATDRPAFRRAEAKG